MERDRTQTKLAEKQIEEIDKRQKEKGQRVDPAVVPEETRRRVSEELVKIYRPLRSYDNHERPFDWRLARACNGHGGVLPWQPRGHLRVARPAAAFLDVAVALPGSARAKKPLLAPPPQAKNSTSLSVPA